ncbi:MAG TPA: hypothetical protein PLQ36_00930 [Candidatus Gracilibacteria bacterium]|nr:hypothetical protein [Candidatus Gracilibacteria bacterium]
MNDYRNLVRNMLDKTILLSPQNKKIVLDGLNSFDENQIDLLLLILQEANETQEQMLNQMIEQNPAWISELDQLVFKEQKQERQKNEEQERNSEDELAEHLLNNLN